jgi:GNAT superfamily N-acetyltransferase
MRIVAVDPGEPLFEAVYADVLTPSFPPEERGSLDDLRAGAEGGSTDMLAVLDDGGAAVACAIGDWSSATEVALLSYLAVRPGGRGSGAGGELLGAALARWRDRWHPALVLAEIEHPGAHTGSPAYGNPDQRVRFYARFGARAMVAPYFQPSLTPGGPRVYGMMLCTLDIAPAGAGPAPDTVDGARVRRFLTEYLEAAEGGVGDDPACAALFGAVDRPDGVPVIDILEYGQVPRSTPDGPVG